MCSRFREYGDKWRFCLRSPSGQAPTLRGLWDDLQGLERRYTLSVLTGSKRLSIALPARGLVTVNNETVNVGPFAVLIFLPGREQMLRILPVPDISPVVDGYCHPHVAVDGELCAGEFAGSIKAALLEGRLADVVDLVDQLLSSYDKYSSYTSLERFDPSQFDATDDEDNGDHNYDEDEEDENEVESDEGEVEADEGGSNPIDLSPGQYLASIFCLSCQRLHGYDVRVISTMPTRCEECGTWTCPGCIWVCAACGVRTCRRCFHMCSAEQQTSTSAEPILQILDEARPQ
jgi:hypothetical protein